MRWFRRSFITGLVVLLPVIVTGYILWFGFNLLDGWWRSLFVLFLGYTVPGAGAVLTVVVTVAIGAIATNVIGRQLISLGERLLGRIPLVRSIYTTAKQVVDVFAGGQKEGFQRVVLVEYPRRGIYTIGFLTAPAAPSSTRDATGEDLWSVFVPTSPNPTTGWVALVPPSQCRPVDMSIDEAFRVIVSGGVLVNHGASSPGIANSHARPPATAPATGSS